MVSSPAPALAVRRAMNARIARDRAVALADTTRRASGATACMGVCCARLPRRARRLTGETIAGDAEVRPGLTRLRWSIAALRNARADGESYCPGCPVA